MKNQSSPGLLPTQRLLGDHRMIRKVLEGVRPGQPRLGEILKTLSRSVLAHAWFENEVLLPGVSGKGFWTRCFLDEIVAEHADIEKLLDLVQRSLHRRDTRFSDVLIQLKGVLNAHFLKEEEALFPLIEHHLSVADLRRLSDEMDRRQSEARRFSTESRPDRQTV